MIDRGGYNIGNCWFLGIWLVFRLVEVVVFSGILIGFEFLEFVGCDVALWVWFSPRCSNTL